MTTVEFLLRTLELNELSRTGWERRGIDNPQLVAGHVWDVVFLTFLFASEVDGLNEKKALHMAIIHDLAEVEVGDIVIEEEDTSISAEEKSLLERKGLKHLLSPIKGDISRGNLIYQLWEEYEDRRTLEAKFVKDMDLVEVCLFALKYEMENRYEPKALENDNNDHLDGFFETVDGRMQTEVGERLFIEIKEKYESAKYRSSRQG